MGGTDQGERGAGGLMRDHRHGFAVPMMFSVILTALSQTRIAHPSVAAILFWQYL
ncbi:MAG: hypothetical protein HW373_1422 [Deltaproteobacteria bacterium]|nr:hypothetical protein [Deltaproteobacteria bacterium]